MTTHDDERSLVPTREVVRRYGVTDRTLAAWTARRETEFPLPVVVNGRKFWRRAELEAWERTRSNTEQRVAR